MKTLTHEEVTGLLKVRLKKWTLKDSVIQRDFKFRNFINAFSFMTAVALEAEKTDHHPDWSNSYNKVSISLTTHSSKGLTQLDIDLAEKIDQLFLLYEKS
jgi:4a-hydroxytetrahydrobiopterin dehydratase